jgi:glycosyltransferase involved in cell wall biosynthesis
VIPVIHIITMLELGGAQQNTLHTVSHLDRARFRPYLIAGEGGILDPEARALDDVPFFPLPDLRREILPHRDLLALGQIRSRIRAIVRANPGRVAIVHTHSSKAGILGRWAAWLERVPVIVHTFHGFGFHEGQGRPVRWVFETAERLTGRITHAFIMVSRANMEKARRLGIAPVERMTLIRSGIPIEEFLEVEERREEIRASLGVGPDEALVTMVACLKPQKAPLDFVEVARRVASQEPRARFLLAGDGVLRGRVEEAASSCGLEGRFQLLGWRRDIPRILHASDVLVLTSRWEGLPRVLPQAMAAGLPVVATSVDGSPEAVEDGVNGFLVLPGQVEAMASRVLALLRDPDLRRRMGEEGRARVGEFDIGRMVVQQEELYAKLASSSLDGHRRCRRWSGSENCRLSVRGRRS